jgi:hypothetical protein
MYLITERELRNIQFEIMRFALIIASKLRYKL